MCDTTHRRLLVLFGTQTGTAEDVAHQIARTASRLHIHVETSPMDDYQPVSRIFSEDLVVFVCATSGQGVPPSNMSRFWNALRRSNLPCDFLDNLRFTIFGLGDSSYPKFNWVAKKLFRRLIQLGAQSFFEPGVGDDQNINRVDTTLLPWLEGLARTLKQLLPIPNGLTEISDTTCLPPTFLLEPYHDASQKTIETWLKSDSSLDLSHFNLATLSKNLRLTSPDHWQDTRHMELDLDQSIDFEPGSVCEILPENSLDDVEKLFQLMNWEDEINKDQIYKLTRLKSEQEIPMGWKQYSTIQSIFKTRLDFTRVPNRSFIDWIRFFATDELERSRLDEFCSIDGQDDLFEYINKPRRTILEVLTEFKSVKIPINYIHDVFPPIRPRQFSIASSPKVFPNQVHLLVAILNYKTRLSVPRKGLCTNWLSQLQPRAKIPIKITRGIVKFPKKETEPVICIGPGTGIAPFRSLVQHRFTYTPDVTSEGPIRIVVFFGCRFESKDFYYRDEWNRSVEKGVCKFFCAASRDQSNKRYVQDLLMENSDLVWDILGVQNGSIFISGSAGEMPKNVRSRLLEIFELKGGLNSIQAEEFLQQLDSLGKLQEDTWG